MDLMKLMRCGIYGIIIFYMVLSCSSASNCGDCEVHWANLTNIILANATSDSGQLVGTHSAYCDVNLSYIGCLDLNNTVVANSTDKFGHAVGPIVVYRGINSYFAGLDITKIPTLVTNLTEVGPDLVLVEYNITVTNIGQVNVTGIWVYDPRLGNYTLGNLLPGENVSIEPHPYYAITPDDVKYCSINNVAMVMGKDRRCCKSVGPILAYANVPLAAKNLERYFKEYTYQLLEMGYDLQENGDAVSLEDFEMKIRIQANRLMVLEDAMHGNVSSCQIPPPVNFAVVEAEDILGGRSCPQAASQIVSS